jgi:aminocarboxymuconate-semialdehyde decarboxylase
MMGNTEIKQYWLPWLVGMPAETSRAICSLIFGGVFEKLPNLKIAFAHGGGSFPSTIGRIQHGFNVRPDLCAVDNKIDPESYLGKFWVDSLVHDPSALSFLIEKVGKDKVMLGTDYPFPLGDLEPGKLIESSDYNDKTKEMILSENSLDWLGLPQNYYI